MRACGNACALGQVGPGQCASRQRVRVYEIKEVCVCLCVSVSVCERVFTVRTRTRGMIEIFVLPRFECGIRYEIINKLPYAGLQ